MSEDFIQTLGIIFIALLAGLVAWMITKFGEPY